MKLYDAVVIGGGAAGITASLYLVRAGCKVALVEKLTPGGQILQTESIENYPGFPKGVKGWELADLFAAHVADLPMDRFSDAVSRIAAGAPGRFDLRIGEQDIAARTVLICTGCRHRPLGLPGEKELTGKGVSYCAICDGNFFRGQRVAVVGGGNTALEESLYLSRIVGKLHLVHRRDAFRGAKIYQDRILGQPDVVQVHWNSVITALHGTGGLEGLTLRNVVTGDEDFLPVDGLFVFVGMEPNGEFLPDMLQCDSRGFILTDAEMRTNVPGMFAAGDIRSKLCRQVTTAVGDGATAAQAAFVYLENLDA